MRRLEPPPLVGLSFLDLLSSGLASLVIVYVFLSSDSDSARLARQPLQFIADSDLSEDLSLAAQIQLGGVTFSSDDSFHRSSQVRFVSDQPGHLYALLPEGLTSIRGAVWVRADRLVLTDSDIVIIWLFPPQGGQPKSIRLASSNGFMSRFSLP
jgi:hypothetical protein